MLTAFKGFEESNSKVQYYSNDKYIQFVFSNTKYKILNFLDFRTILNANKLHFY